MSAARVVFALFAAAQAAPVVALDWSPLVSLGFTKGGDSLGKSVETSQNKTTTHHIRAGQFMLLNAGATFALPGLDDWEAQATVGYWFDSVSGNGGELRFKRIPIDVVAIRNFDATWRVSGGVTYHTAVERRCTQDACTVPNTAFDDALGFIAEIDWLVGGPVTAGRAEGQPAATKVWFGARLTLIEYQAPDSEGGSYSGNNLGLILGLNF